MSVARNLFAVLATSLALVSPAMAQLKGRDRRHQPRDQSTPENQRS